MNSVSVFLGVCGLCFFAYQFWGHNKPLAGLLLAVALLGPIAGKLIR